MKLLRVQIQDFRCIEDSGEFRLDQVTCLVGKNESGKTALLKALHKLKNASDDKFVPIDYPRRKWRPNIPIPENPAAIETKWELDNQEMVALEGRFGKGTITNREFTLSKGYDNVRRFSISTSEKSLIKHLLADLEATEKKALADADTIKALQAALLGIASRTSAQEKLNQKLASEFADNNAHLAVINVVAEMVPTFLYFDQYLRLPGQVSVDALIPRKASNALTDGDRIFMALKRICSDT